MTNADEEEIRDQGSNENGLLAHFVVGGSSSAIEGVTVVAGNRPLPPPLDERSFWDAYVWSPDGDRPDGFGSYAIDLYVADRQGLRLSVGSDDDLYLLHPDLLHPPHLGLLNNYHCWHPFALRWEELDAISRRVSERAGFPHPGIPLILLAGFTLPDPDQRTEALDMLRLAFDTIGLFDATAIDKLVDRYDYRDESAITPYQGPADRFFAEEPVIHKLSRRWVRNAQCGWVMEGDHGYSFRVACNDAFPFGTLWDLVRIARNGIESAPAAVQLELPPSSM